MVKNILVIGSGGREHAVCKAFLQSNSELNIFALPGNAGTALIATNISHLNINNHHEVVNFCQEQKIDLVFVGPEQPLVDGLVDSLQQQQILVFGPNKKAAQLEGSKIFMKQIATLAKVPTARYQQFTSAQPALQYCLDLGFPCVIKADGLASGKGVIIANNQQEAQDAINNMFLGQFGLAGQKIIIEEFLTGYEVSYFVIADGSNFVSLGFVCDHKKVGENETGLNTGGMGTFSPVEKISKQMQQKIDQEIILPTISALQQQNINFCGVLFAGLMITNQGPKLLEFNVRFGDPETQVLLPRIGQQFLALILASVHKKLADFELFIDETKKLVCVVLCAKGYPVNHLKNQEITGLEQIKQTSDCYILHAGTIIDNNKIIANGGRVLNVVAIDDDFAKARDKAYNLLQQINWQQGFYRKDIALEVI
jgi:phosphoribosylamine--glycine ligase